MSDLKHKLVVWEPTADGAVRVCVRKLYSCSGCDFVTQHLDMILDHIDTEETDQRMQELKLAAVQTPPQLEVKESMMAPDTKGYLHEEVALFHAAETKLTSAPDADEAKQRFEDHCKRQQAFLAKKTSALAAAGAARAPSGEVKHPVASETASPSSKPPTLSPLATQATRQTTETLSTHASSAEERLKIHLAKVKAVSAPATTIAPPPLLRCPEPVKKPEQVREEEQAWRRAHRGLGGYHGPNSTRLAAR